MNLVVDFLGLQRQFVPRGVPGWLAPNRRPPWLRRGEAAYPPVNFREDGSAVVMGSEIAGFATENIDLTTTDASVTVKVARGIEGDMRPERYHVRERYRGEFGGTVAVPAKADNAKAAASNPNGVLAVTLSERDEVKAGRIAVEST